MKTYLKVLNGLVWVFLMIMFCLLLKFSGWMNTGIEDVLWNDGYKFYYYSALIVKVLWVSFWVIVAMWVYFLTDKKIDKLFK